MKKKLFIFIYTSAIVLAVVILNAIVTTIREHPSSPPSAIEQADTELAQYTERPNSTWSTASKSRFAFLFDYFFPRTQALEKGCSLGFSLVPKAKAVEPYGTTAYTLTIVNKGDETCANVSLSMYYPESETFVSSEPQPTASDYYWAFGDLGPGDRSTITLSTKIALPSGSQYNAEGCATADNASDVCAQIAMFVQTGASKGTSLTQKLNIPFVTRGYLGSLFKSKQKELGIWVWDSPAQMSPAYAQNVITVSKKNGFTTLYVSIDDYLAIADIPSYDRKDQKSEYMKTLSVFIAAANANGLQVDVVGGAKDWSIDQNRWKGYDLIDFVQEYNKTYGQAKIHALQYDVEPYLLPQYNADKQKVLKDFVSFVDESAYRMKNVDAGFSIVIPHFYDQAQNWTPEYTYKGYKGSTYTHLLRALKQKDNTSIIIMAYRNFFDDDNGIKAISEAEIKEATQGGYPTKIIVAQETGNVQPAYVTFYDYPKSSLFDTIREIQNYFDQYDAFGGVAVHYFDPFLKME